MRILYISTPPLADCDFPLIRAFQEKSIDVTYLIMLSPHNRKTTLFSINSLFPQKKIFRATDYDELCVYKDYFDLNKVFILNNPLGKSSWACYKSMERFVAEGHYDIVHITGHFTMFDCLLYRYGNKMVRTIHDPFPHSETKSWKSTFFRKLCLKYVNRVVLLNQKYKTPFSDHYHFNIKKIDINRLGVYDNIRLYRNTQIKPIENNILFFGRISPYKGVEFIMEAMDELREYVPNASLVIAGSGRLYMDPSLYENKKYIKILNKYIDMQCLAELLMKCELVVCPYIEATQSGVVMTAFSMLKPVVATNVGSLDEQIINGYTGTLVPPRSSKALCGAIIDLLLNKDKLRQMSNNIEKEYFDGQWSWSVIADHYLDTYRTIVENKETNIN